MNNISTAKIISIGYEKRSIDDFLNLLLKYKVEKLLDVRKLPLSRKKGFSKKRLSSHLQEAGIQYCHMFIAGNPYHKEKVSLEKCLEMYACYLENNPEIIEAVASEISVTSIAVLCYEREHRYCHRSVLLDMLFQHVHSIEIIVVK